MRRSRGKHRLMLLTGLAAAAAPFLFEALAARAGDDTPPPPPPPRKRPPPGVVDPTFPDFEGAMLGDLNQRTVVGAETIVSAVGGKLSQPVWIKQPGMELRCDSVVIWGDKDRIDAALQPHSRTLDVDSKSILGPVIHAIYAEGHVFLRREHDVIEADRVLVDFAKDRAYIVNARIAGNHTLNKDEGDKTGRNKPAPVNLPLVVRAAVARGTANSHYKLENASISASRWEKPQLQFRTGELEVDYSREETEFSTAWWPTVRMDTLLGEATPILVVPVLGGTTGSDGIQTIEFSSSNRFGTTLGVGVGGRLKDDQGKAWGVWQVIPRYRSARGPGLEVKFDHKPDPVTGKDGSKTAQPFYEFNGELQRDSEQTDSYSNRPFDGLVGGESDNNRGAVDFFWRSYGLARSLFGGQSRLDIQADWYSDRGYLSEYHDDATLVRPQQDTYASLTSRAGDQGLSIFASHRLSDETVSLVPDRAPASANDFFVTDFANQTQYLPSATYHLVSHPLWRSPDNQMIPYPSLSVEAGIARVERRYDVEARRVFERTLGWQSKEITRGDLETRLTAPFEAGPVEFTPSVGASVYGVSDANGFANAGRPESDDPAGRNALSAGLRIGTEAHRLYDVSNTTLDLRGLRHVVSTDLQWFDRFHVSGNDADPGIFQANDLHDRLVEENIVSWRLRNRLQTKRDGEVVDWFDWESRFLYYLDATPSPGGSGLGLREDFATPLERLDFPGEDKYLSRARDGSSFVQNRVRLQALKNVWLVGESDYDFERSANETTGAGVRWFLDDRFSLYLGRRTIGGDSAVWTLRGDYELSKKWGISGEFQEDTKNNKGLRTRLALFRRAREYTIAVEFQTERLLDETSFSLALYPNDWLARKNDPFSDRRPLDFAALKWYR